MTTKKKSTKVKPSSNKRFLSKVHHAVKEDVVKSIAIASVLLNVLALVTVIVLTSTNTFSRGIFIYTQDKYCSNIEGIKNRATELGNENAAIDEWQISCVGKDFKPFYKEAVDKYRAQNNQ